MTRRTRALPPRHGRTGATVAGPADAPVLSARASIDREATGRLRLGSPRAAAGERGRDADGDPHARRRAP